MQIILRQVRSFIALQRIPIRPLTILVGENSAGKTTFLSIVSCIYDTSRFPTHPGFNEPPYNLGTFDTIATSKNASIDESQTFSIGLSTSESAEDPGEVVATYGTRFGDVRLTQLDMKKGGDAVELNLSADELSGKLHLSNLGVELSQPIHFQQTIDSERALSGTSALQQQVRQAIFNQLTRSNLDKPALNKAFIVSARAELVMQATLPPHNCLSFAPIRSKPKRTYDVFVDRYSPEGEHIPTLLASLIKQESKSDDLRRLREVLKRFGEDSGLFKKIDVKRLGKNASDPFQIQASVAGRSANLADVGYGVSQALPVVVQCMLSSSSDMLLMQQPEVHLHPRAQAALGTLFAKLVADGNRIFLIETHSDHLVDRIRQEVARGTVSADQVLILFFHKPNLETTVWPITLDALGNVENAPPEYRSFFLEEELSLLGRTGE